MPAAPPVTSARFPPSRVIGGPPIARDNPGIRAGARPAGGTV